MVFHLGQTAYCIKTGGENLLNLQLNWPGQAAWQRGTSKQSSYLCGQTEIWYQCVEIQKPVPVNPIRFTRRFNGRRVTMRTGMMITAAAGPASNLVFGFLSAVLLKVVMLAGVTTEPVLMILVYLVMVNYGLAIFNMIPLPPLDGSKVLAGVLPRNLQRYFDYLESNTFVSFIVLIALLNTGVLGYIIGPVIRWLLRFTDSIVDLPFI